MDSLVFIATLGVGVAVIFWFVANEARSADDENKRGEPFDYERGGFSRLSAEFRNRLKRHRLLRGFRLQR